jgi:uncharacterized repeat protein (TIGR04052 family)
MHQAWKQTIRTAIGTATVLTMTGCDEGGAGVVLRFEARVGERAFACGESYDTVGENAQSVEFSDFRLYISDIVLIDASGREVPAPLVPDGRWQGTDVALLDFEDQSGACTNGTPELRTEVETTVPPGEWTGVRFTLGVPFALNHGDTAVAPSPLNLSALFWNWQAGYKFLRLDARVNGERGFNTHVGSIGCSMDVGTATVGTCERPNRARVALDGFDPAMGTIVLDAASLFEGIDLSADAGGAPGCMSSPDDPECRPIFEALGLSVDDAETRPGQRFATGEAAP